MNRRVIKALIFTRKNNKYLTACSILLMLIGTSLFIMQSIGADKSMSANSRKNLQADIITIEDNIVPQGVWKDDIKEVEIDIKYPEDAEGEKNKDDILYVLKTEVMSLDNKGNFNPKKNVTRAEITSIFGRVENIVESDYKKARYSDVPVDSKYACYIEWASQNKVVANIQDNKFRPNDNVTREELAVMLCNYIRNVNKTALVGGGQIVDYKDISPWAKEEVMLMLGSEYMEQKGKNEFKPHFLVTRSEIATIIANMMRRLEL